jgi:SAM-dependent methyltransferase
MMPFEKILNNLEAELDLISPDLREWNISYFTQHRNRYKSDLELVREYYKEGSILEIGSLPCHLTYCLGKLGYLVTGLDIEPARAENFIKKNDLNIVRCNIETEKIPFANESFHLILFNEIFEHLRIDPIWTLKEIHRILNPAGRLILSTPNLYAWKNITAFLKGKGLGNPYEQFEKLYTLGHMGHVREYSSTEVKLFLEKSGFEVIKINYKTYDTYKKFYRGLRKKIIYKVMPFFRPYLIFIAAKARP